MPHPLPLLGDRFDEGCQALKAYCRRVEQNHQTLIAPNSGLTLTGVELTYELVFLKVFLLWERFQQDVFLRLMLGYESNGGSETLKPGIGPFRSLATAEVALLSGKRYRLWHDPAQVMQRSDAFFVAASSYFRSVVGANQVALAQYATIRHQIAHAQSHARAEFDNTTMSLSGKRYSGKVGKFLRDQNVDGTRWFEIIVADLSDVAHQIC